MTLCMFLNLVVLVRSISNDQCGVFWVQNCPAVHTQRTTPLTIIVDPAS